MNLDTTKAPQVESKEEVLELQDQAPAQDQEQTEEQAPAEDQEQTQDQEQTEEQAPAEDQEQTQDQEQTEEQAPAEDQAEKKYRTKNKNQKQILVNCKKFQYLGTQPYRFKDTYGNPYIANPNQILIVPNDSLARHFKYKKLYFKEL